jgi:hypothetical protein
MRGRGVIDRIVISRPKSVLLFVLPDFDAFDTSDDLLAAAVEVPAGRTSIRCDCDKPLFVPPSVTEDDDAFDLVCLVAFGVGVASARSVVIVVVVAGAALTIDDESRPSVIVEPAVPAVVAACFGLRSFSYC